MSAVQTLLAYKTMRAVQEMEKQQRDQADPDRKLTRKERRQERLNRWGDRLL